MVQESTHQEESTSPAAPAAVEAPSPVTPRQLSVYFAQIGAKGGKIGGKRRLETMSGRQRKIAATKAALARWGKSPKKS